MSTNNEKDPAFYSLFVVINNGKPTAANCKCPAGETQTCVHVAALLITLSEVIPTHVQVSDVHGPDLR